ncbi:zinc finger protein 721-like protein [Dinothrombium tinctorium]|uniref:Zinc finger protein 721-like protein n=1 Tax=Dinothrombium tinctorium TaxID=1965070 RepID=A0A443R345_9ACAR|nr:zinc finger protein 721-like protein [Dinothrombium tinctorium]
MESNAVSHSALGSTDASSSARGQTHLIPFGVTITEIKPGAKISVGNQVSVKEVVSSSNTGSSIYIPSSPLVTNPVLSTKSLSNNTVITFASTAFNRNQNSNSYINTTLRRLSEVDIKEVPSSGQDKAMDSADQNGNSQVERRNDTSIDLDDSINMEDPQWSEVAASKTQYVCDGCGKGFCYIGWLDRHKLQSKACQNPTKSLAAAPANAASNATESSSSETATQALLSKRDRDRQSLQGRLQELLQCPHPQCNFATYWLQSLTKHVNYTCKFGPVLPQTENATNNAAQTVESAPPKTSAPVTCTFCSKKCSDVQEHIDHMTSVHRMKASYRCSTCAQTFPTKVAVEAHLQTHTKMSGNSTTNPSVHYSLESNNQLDKCKNEKIAQSSVTQTQQPSQQVHKRKQSLETLTTSIEIAEEEDDENFMTQNEVYKCDCGKVYLQKSSYEQHIKTCKVVTSPEPEAEESSSRKRPVRSVFRSSTDSNDEMECEHFRREQIQAIHPNDARCRHCSKEFPTIKSLCNHLCRSTDCREIYCKKLVPEVCKSEENTVATLPKKPRLSMETSKTLTSDGEKTSTHGTDHPRRAASIAAQSTLKLSLTGHYVQSKESPSTYTSPTKPQKAPIQCPKCLKLFGGKSPHVAYNNHLRSFKPCVPPDKARKNILKYQQQQQQQQQQLQQNEQQTTQISSQSKSMSKQTPVKTSSFPHSQIKNLHVGTSTPNVNMNKVSLEAIQQGVKYYCKLCPNSDIKNRVSLGCHLTIYHGLPQVNVATDSGDSFRCQTCCQIFNSKYFYNMHRYECDLTSPYVGVLNEDGSEATLVTAKSQETRKAQITISSKNTQKQQPSEQQSIRSNYFTNSYKCSLCNKSGFWNPNSVKIHQKYQCAKRAQVQTSKPIYPSMAKQKFSNGRIRNQLTTSNGNQDISHPGMSIAKMNDLAKSEPSLTMCDACGRGPYNSYYYFIEHKRLYCRALKNKKSDQSQVVLTGPATVTNGSKFAISKAVKTITHRRPNIAKKSMPIPPYSAFITPQTAKKTLNHHISPEIDDKQLQIVHYADGDDLFDENLEDEPQDQIVKCSVCSKELENIEKFVHHRLRHITDEISGSSSPEPLKCEICSAKISHYQRMQQHLILHLQNFTVVRQKDLIEIKRKKAAKADEDSDDDEPLLTCPYCKANYVSRVDLANHIRNACPSRYQCPQCQRTYLTKESLTEHKEQCIRNALLRPTSARPAFKCRTCGLDFKVKQQLLWHEHACSKVYSADLAGRIEEIIFRTLTCSVCGMVSKDYDNKHKHETRCLQRYLSDVGTRPPIAFDSESDIEPYKASNCDDLSSLKSSVNNLDEEKIKKLKERYGIDKEVRVSIEPQDLSNYRDQLPMDGESEAVKLDILKELFDNILRMLIKEEDVYEEVTQHDAPEIVLNRMLKHLGEKPVEANGLNELTCFSQNLQTFLKLVIKEETLEKANHQAKSIEEVITNLLRFPYELK